MRKVRLRDEEQVVETGLEASHPDSWIQDDISPSLDTEARLHVIISYWFCP